MDIASMSKEAIILKSDAGGRVLVPLEGVMQHFSTYTPDRRILPHATDPARRV